MAEHSFVEDLEEELTCPVCDEIFTEPKTLGCLHTFCFSCLKRLNKTSANQGRQLQCPICRIPVSGGISKLPSYLGFESLRALLQAIKTMTSGCGESQQEWLRCVGCSNEAMLVAFCLQCRGLICRECSNAHRTLKTILGDHQTTKLDQFQHEHLNSYINDQVCCKERSHEKNKLEVFCQTCYKSICQKCAEETHSSHEMEKVVIAAGNAKKSIRENMNDIKLLLEKWMLELELSKDDMTGFESQISAAKKKVSEVVRAQIETLLNHESIVTKALDETLQEQQALKNGEQADLTQRIQQLAECRHQGYKLEEKDITLRILESQHSLQDLCKALMEGKFSKKVKRNVNIRYAPDLQVMEYLQNPGKIVESETDPARCSIELLDDARCGFINHFNIVTRNSDIEVCYTNRGLLDIKIKDADGKEVDHEVTECGTGKFSVAYRATKPSPYRILVSIGEETISNSPQKIKTIDLKETFTSARAFTLGDANLYNPCSLALSGTGELVITDTGNNRVVILDSNGEYLREFGGKGKGDLSRPWGAACDQDRILVSDNPDEDGRIQEFSIGGAYIRTIYRQKRVELLGMCITDRNIACLEDGEAHRNIKVFDKQTGELVQEIRIDGIAGNPPTFLAYNNGKFFVPFVDQNCIRVFDDNGAFLYNFGDKGNKVGQFNCVAGLTAFGGEAIFVCDAGNHRVQVLTQEGKFISSFGCRGSDLGQMEAPIDVVVTPEGKVFVLECDGSRVQMWR